jgi:hypothetical protein
MVRHARRLQHGRQSSFLLTKHINIGLQDSPTPMIAPVVTSHIQQLRLIDLTSSQKRTSIESCPLFLHLFFFQNRSIDGELSVSNT